MCCATDTDTRARTRTGTITQTIRIPDAGPKPKPPPLQHEDEHEDNEGFFADHDSAATYFGFEDETAGQGAPQSQNEIVWEGQEMQHPRDEPIDDSQYAISDAEIGRLFDISAASAAARARAPASSQAVK